LFEEDAAMAPLRTPENAARVACSSGNLFREEIQGGGEGIFPPPPPIFHAEATSWRD